jgi:hypothetical protein
MTDIDEELTKGEAFAELTEMDGDSYYFPEKAFKVLGPFSEDATEAFLKAYGMEDYPSLVFAEAIAEEQTLARDARGIPSVHAFQPIITGNEASGLLMDALELDRNTGASVGGARSSREAHESNVSDIAEELDLDVEKAET